MSGFRLLSWTFALCACSNSAAPVDSQGMGTDGGADQSRRDSSFDASSANGLDAAADLDAVDMHGDAPPDAAEASWVASLGGKKHDYGHSIAQDSSGNTYVAGSYSRVLGITTIDYSRDVVVAKYSDLGAEQWLAIAGGNDHDSANAIAVDGAGNCYVAGSFTETATFGTTTLAADGVAMFVAKLDPFGKYIWAVTTGSTSDANGVALDTAGNVLVAGSYKGAQALGTVALPATGSTDLFVAKLDPGGNVLWVTSGGGPGGDHALDIAVHHPQNTICLGGYFLDKAVFGNTEVEAGGLDMLVAKLDSSGSFLWASSAGSKGSMTVARGVAVGKAESCYVTGSFEGDVQFASTSLSSKGESDVFVTKVDSGGSFLWASAFGGADDDQGSGIAVDTLGNTYITGEFRKTAEFDATTITAASFADIFIVKIDAATKLLWAASAGGTQFAENGGSDLALTRAGAVLATGWFRGAANFGPTALTGQGKTDLFVWKVPKSGL